MGNRAAFQEQQTVQPRLSYHSLRRRALYAFLLVFSVVFIGTVAFHYIEGYSYINAFYFVSMIATAQGPATTPATDLGKIVAALLAFISVGAVIFALGFLFGPFFGKVMRMEERRLEKDEKKILDL
jgi:voltage-gated potassium channel